MKKSVLKIAFYCALLLGFTSCASNGAFVKVSEKPEYTNVIHVENGDLVGVYNSDKSIEIYAGIPFAKPPVGELRWKAPQDCENWTGVKKCDTFSAMPVQNQNSPFMTKIWNTFITHNKKGDRTDFAPVSEDCLYLNIWKPASDEKNLPVLVYIHGGGLTSGSSYFESYDGEKMAQKGNIIRVNIAYRTGIFGFLTLPELESENEHSSCGNYGLLDQIKALEWVQKNIASFGGNPDNVTIAGESAGASCVSALCVSPLAKGLFKNAIAESSSLIVRIPSHTFYSKQDYIIRSRKALVDLGVSSVQELRNLPCSELLKVTSRFNGLTIDGWALTEYPWESAQKGIHNEQNLLHGYNAHEGYFFTVLMGVDKKSYPKLLQKAFPGEQYWKPIYEMYPASNKKQAKTQYDKIFTANAFSYPHYEWSQSAMQNSIPVYEYYFSKENGGIGSNHSGEMIYAYGNVLRDTKIYNETDYALEQKMMSYFINFAKKGNPNGMDTEGSELTYWPELSENPTKIFEFGDNIGVIEEPFLNLYPLLKNFRDSINPTDKLNWDPRD